MKITYLIETVDDIRSLVQDPPATNAEIKLAPGITLGPAAGPFRINKEIAQLWFSGNRFGAIKEFRTLNGSELGESKSYLEAVLGYE